jgi:hypothetical protein
VLRQWARGESQAAGGAGRATSAARAADRPASARGRAAALATLRADQPSADGSRRLLVGLVDGRSVEAVLLPRGGLCVSSQVGCAVGCVFCMTGVGGLERQLGSAEIVAQVALARTLRPVTKVVFMGMGEPAHNLDAVLDAIDLLGTAAASATRTWSSRQSAIGASSSACRWARQAGAGLSLHTTDAALRARCCRVRRPSRPTSWWHSAMRMRGHRLSDAGAVDPARRHQRQRRRDRRAGAPPRRQVRDSEPDSVQRRRRTALARPAPSVAGDGARAALRAAS